jgi:hypothetical protein
MDHETKPLRRVHVIGGLTGLLVLSV